MKNSLDLFRLLVYLRYHEYCFELFLFGERVPL